MNPKWAVVALYCLCSVTLGQNETDLWAKYEKQLKEKPHSSITHFRVGEIYLQLGDYLSAGNAFREALNGDLQPRWVEVWSRINLGKIADILGQRNRAVNEYMQAQRTNDNTRGAMEEAAIYLEFPYPQKRASKK